MISLRFHELEGGDTEPSEAQNLAARMALDVANGIFDVVRKMPELATEISWHLAMFTEREHWRVYADIQEKRYRVWVERSSKEE